MFQFKFHLVLSAFTLMELPDLKTRLQTLLTLWKKCDGYMVLVENGTNAGFNLIHEAREFLLQQTKESKDPAYLFAPVRMYMVIHKEKHRFIESFILLYYYYSAHMKNHAHVLLKKMEHHAIL